jgi:tetratricopeptide (TPR) repeat protein
MTPATTGVDAPAFAGRTAELSILKAAADAAKDGRFSAILISGEPGIGKTRLTEEAGSYARSLGLDIASGRCFETQSRFSYFPFVSAFSHLVKLPLSQVASAARGGGKRADKGLDILERLAIRVPRSARPEPEATTAQTALFESVAGFLRARTECSPLLLVLEDLDWADEGSLSLLLYLVRMLTTARLLIIATGRGNEALRRLELRRTIIECGRLQCWQRIRLRGLSETEAVSLVQKLVAADSTGETAQLAADIWRLTNGNPLFIVQIVRHLVETGRLYLSGAEWVASSGWESKLAAEEGMLELVDARLSRLSEGCREVLNHAAVLGDEFEFEVLAQMLPLAATDLSDLLEEASSGGIVTEARNNETADYAFAHGLIRQSLYERQSRPAKRALHAGAARAIEAVYGGQQDSHLSQLALHYTRAGRAGDAARAVEYSMRAGEMAYGVCAYADAACHWRTALQLVSARDRKLRAELMERLGEASLLSATTPADAARHLQAALKLYAELGQETDTARVHARLVLVISLLSMNPTSTHVGQAVSHSRRAERLLATRADPGAEGKLLIGEALVAHAQFRTDDGLAVSRRAIEIGQHLEDVRIWCQAAAWHGHFLWATGKLNEGLSLMEQAVERAERTNDVESQFAAAWLLSFSYLLLWDPGAAERTIQAALAQSDTGQVDFLRQVLVAHLGIANTFTGALVRVRSLLTIAPHHFLEANLHFFSGEWTEAEELWSQQIDRAHVAQSKQQHWTASFWLARLKRIQGDNRRALELLTNTPLIAQSLHRIPEEIATRCELTLLRLALEEVAEARSEVRRCRALLTASEGWRGLLAFVERAEAAVLAHEGFLEEAGQLWISAGKIFSQYHLPWEVAETLLTWAQQLQRHGKGEEAAAKFAATAQIYRHLELGARWHNRIAELAGQATTLSATTFSSAPPDVDRANLPVQTPARSDDIYSLVGTHDVALLATLIHDAIAHLMNAIDKASKMRVPIERIAAATEEISRIGRPVERLARALEQAGGTSIAGASQEASQRRRSRARRQKLDRGHDPGRPL